MITLRVVDATEGHSLIPGDRLVLFSRQSFPELARIPFESRSGYRLTDPEVCAIEAAVDALQAGQALVVRAEIERDADGAMLLDQFCGTFYRFADCPLHYAEARHYRRRFLVVTGDRGETFEAHEYADAEHQLGLHDRAPALGEYIGTCVVRDPDILRHERDVV